MMSKFKIPIIKSLTEWIEVEAESLKEALDTVIVVNKQDVDYSHLFKFANTGRPESNQTNTEETNE